MPRNDPDGHEIQNEAPAAKAVDTIRVTKSLNSQEKNSQKFFRQICLKTIEQIIVRAFVVAGDHETKVHNLLDLYKALQLLLFLVRTLPVVWPETWSQTP